LPLWRAILSGEPDASWRRRFARAAHIDGLFAGRRITFEGPSLVFEIERAALTVACREIDRWIAGADGEASAPPDVTPEQPAKGTILVVDDEPEIGPLAQDILTSDGYAVFSTTDPLEAIRMLHDRTCVPDLLLVDVVMPVMGGRELAVRLREFQPEMKVLLMSGYEVAGIEETGWPFLQKPFAVTALTLVISQVLGAPN
jgi:CheY-like chemotaxis protein